jgi:hypothetical protein
MEALKAIPFQHCAAIRTLGQMTLDLRDLPRREFLIQETRKHWGICCASHD